MKTQLRTLLAGGIFACSPAFAQTGNPSTTSTNEVLLCTAPVAEEVQTLCNGAKVGDIVATTNDGAVVTWYFVGFVNQVVPVTEDVQDGTRYGVTQTVDGCTSPFTYVVVNLTEAPAEPSGAATQQFNEGDVISSLEISVSPDYTVKWYTRNDAMVYIPVDRDAALIDGTTYYATQSNGNCESAYHAITVSEILGTSNPVLKTLRVYPNPSGSIVTVSNQDAISQITVTNLLGQKVITQKANAALVQLNIASLPAGTYSLQIYTAKGAATAKVVKQ